MPSGDAIAIARTKYNSAIQTEKAVHVVNK